MSNVLSEEKQQQVIALGRLGWPLRRIEKETGVRRETAGAYLKAAGIAVRPPGGWGRRRPAKPANEVSTDSGRARQNRPTRCPPTRRRRGCPAAVRRRVRCEPYFDFIELSLGKGRNAKAIWQDLVDDHGFTGRYASVKRFVRKLRGQSQRRARAVIVTPPGEEAQVDYGDGPMVRDPAHRPLSPHTPVRAHAGLQPQGRSPAHVAVQHAHVGRTSRASVPPAGRRAAPDRPRFCARAQNRNFVADRVMWPTGAQVRARMGSGADLPAHNGWASAHHGCPFGISERRLSCSKLFRQAVNGRPHPRKLVRLRRSNATSNGWHHRVMPSGTFTGECRYCVSLLSSPNCTVPPTRNRQHRTSRNSPSHWLASHGSKCSVPAARSKIAEEARNPVRQMLRLALDGRVTAARTRKSFPFDDQAPGFLRYLREERGLREATIYHYVHRLNGLADYLKQSGVSSLTELSPALLASFVVDTAPKLARTGKRDLCGVIRVFLRFCHRQQVIAKDLSGAVEMPQAYRLADVPRSITWDEVRRMLEAVDRRTALGRRDYAILLLLVTYGLRAHEVAKLTLDDIDWKRERLQIPERKAGHWTAYPLANVVAEALIEYLRSGRPQTQDRHVFFRVLAPQITNHQRRRLHHRGAVPSQSRRAGAPARRTHAAPYLCPETDRSRVPPQDHRRLRRSSLSTVDGDLLEGRHQCVARSRHG